MTSLSTMSAYAGSTPRRAPWCSPPRAAPASRQARTRAFSGLEGHGWWASGRTTRRRPGPGTMLGFSPASVKIPWIRSSGTDVLAQRRHVDVAEHGGVEGVAALRGAPPRRGPPRRGRCHRAAGWRWRPSGRGRAPAGCTIIAASTPSKAPRSAMRILPPPPSSAGVPRITTVPPSSSASAAAARPAPSPAVAMMLWPQAWPMPGRASYSQSTAMVGPAVPASARKAVGSP